MRPLGLARQFSSLPLQKLSFSMFFKIVVLKNFRNIHMKTPMLESLFYKVEGLTTFNVTKKWLQHRCFPGNIAKFFRTPFLIEHLWWLLLPLHVGIEYYVPRFQTWLDKTSEIFMLPECQLLYRKLALLEA